MVTGQEYCTKAGSFAEHLEKTFQPNEGNGFEEWKDIYQAEMKKKIVITKEFQKDSKVNINP